MLGKLMLAVGVVSTWCEECPSDDTRALQTQMKSRYDPPEGLGTGGNPVPLIGDTENVNVVTRRLRVLTRSGSLTLKTCGPHHSIWEASGDTSEPGNWRCKSHRRQWSLSA